MSTKLRECPFCGGEAKIENNDRVIYDPDTLGFVDVEYGEPPCVWAKCCNCDASIGGFDTEAEAIAAWNRRAQPENKEGVNKAQCSEYVTI